MTASELKNFLYERASASFDFHHALFDAEFDFEYRMLFLDHGSELLSTARSL